VTVQTCRSVSGTIRGVTDSLPKTTIAIWRSDAVVLFDWLMTVDLNAMLEETDVMGVTQGEIDVARAEVAQDMSW
jgi:hypothetical protein